MNVIAEARVDLPCSVDTIFPYIINMEHFSDWFPAVKKIQSKSELQHGEVGKVYYETVRLPIIGNVKIPLTVVECEQGAWFVTQGDLPILAPRMEIRFRGLNDNQCELHWLMISRSRFGIGRIAANPFIRQVMQKRAERAMSRLKKISQNQLVKKEGV